MKSKVHILFLSRILCFSFPISKWINHNRKHILVLVSPCLIFSPSTFPSSPCVDVQTFILFLTNTHSINEKQRWQFKISEDPYAISSPSSHYYSQKPLEQTTFFSIDAGCLSQKIARPSTSSRAIFFRRCLTAPKNGWCHAGMRTPVRQKTGVDPNQDTVWLTRNSHDFLLPGRCSGRMNAEFVIGLNGFADRNLGRADS